MLRARPRLLVLFQRTAVTGGLTAIVRHAPEKQPRAELNYIPVAAPIPDAHRAVRRHPD